MSLRSKIVLILSVVVVLYVGFDNIVQRLMVSHSFVELESAEAERDLERVRAGLEEEQADLRALCRSWAGWETTWRFARGLEPGFVASHLGPAALERADLNLLYVVDPQSGRVLWGRIEDTETRRPIPLEGFPQQALAPRQPLLQPLDGAFPVSGLQMTERGPLIVCSDLVRPTADGGEPAGVLIVGRFLDPQRITALGERSRVDFDVWPLDTASLPERERSLLDRITASPTPVHAVDDGTRHVYGQLSDLRRNPAFLLRVNVPQAITGRGYRLVDYALLSTVATALLILFVLLRLLQGIVIRPLTQLTQHAVSIGRTEDTSARVGMQRDDEIGLLAGEFDRMMDKLAKSRQQLVETARLAGMSEIATGVLHNVGNVLNSVNVSANLVARQAERLSVEDLGLMAETLHRHEADLARFVSEDPQGRHLLPFIDELAANLSRERKALLGELRDLSRGIEHIMELVRSQQSFAGKQGVLEPTSLGELLDNALTICRQAYGGAEELEVLREYEELPPLKLEKHKLMEVVVNLVQNARQSMQDAGAHPKRLVLRARRAGPGRARIEVSDNGVGIAPENLERIFNHGFTTRREGHGFGLHISANAATEMRGRLWAESAGPGRGATFVLEIPIREEERAVAA